MSFKNPIAGGSGALILPAVKSPNYVPGSTGWAIKRDGTAEFHGLTVVGGSIQGGQVILDQSGDGLFIYSGTPALGNLLISIAPVAGTDAVGNTYPAGVDVQNNSAVRVRNVAGSDARAIIVTANNAFNIPTVELMPASGTGFAWLNSPANGEAEVSATKAVSPTRTRLYTGVAGGQLESLNVTNDAQYGGRLFVTGNEAGMTCYSSAAAPQASIVAGPSDVEVLQGASSWGTLSAANVNLEDVGRRAIAGNSSAETQQIQWGSNTFTTSATGTVSLDTGFTTLRGFVAWNGDVVARPNMTIGNNRSGWPVSGQVVNITCYQGQSGATINNVAVRIDWIGFGVP